MLDPRFDKAGLADGTSGIATYAVIGFDELFAGLAVLRGDTRGSNMLVCGCRKAEKRDKKAGEEQLMHRENMGLSEALLYESLDNERSLSIDKASELGPRSSLWNHLGHDLIHEIRTSASA